MTSQTCFNYTEPEVSAHQRRRRIRIRKLEVKKAKANRFKKLEVTKAKTIEDREVKVSPFVSAGTVIRGPVQFGMPLDDLGAPLCMVPGVLEIAGREREWDAFMQIGTHSSTRSTSRTILSTTTFDLNFHMAIRSPHRLS